MEDTAYRAIAIVGLGAVLPDAKNVPAFWENVESGRYSITEVAPDRWDPALYYDADPAAPDKTYSKIGGWVRDFTWDAMKWHLPVPPRVVDAMDVAQKWAIACTREALEDYGYPNRPINLDRTAVILGNAMAGEKHYLTALRVYFPEYARELTESASFAALPEAVRHEITRELHEGIAERLPAVTEDSMPGELANCIAGRIANIYNFHGPNYVVDAACASAMAAISSAVEGLVANDFDLAITGGIDRNMGASTYVKFCKIGALSATGTRPFAEGADGFVMGEGAAIFLIKRLADAERDGDKIYAVLRGMGGSSDGKGKGITAPNPIGQRLAIERAWHNAGLSPASATLIEGHGTSTRVGDVVEVQSMVEVLNSFHVPSQTIALGSVKSNIGHLKGAAGAAGLLKTTLALHNKVLPPSVHCEHPNPDIDFAHSPLYVNTELKTWKAVPDTPRRAGLSAFGFGGTNFHAVLEEYLPGKLRGNGKRSIAVTETEPVMTGMTTASLKNDVSVSHDGAGKAPLRGALVIGASSEAALVERLRLQKKDAEAGRSPVLSAPAESDLRAPERLAIDYVDAADLASKSATALKALASNQPAMWKAVRAQGIFRGHGPAPKVAFLYTGQGSQYVNMLRPLRAAEPIVAQAFAEADRVMTPLLGKPLSEFVFVDESDPKAVAKAEEDLRQTAITQPVVLAIDLAMTRLLAAYGIRPDFTMGHSLGEYGALVAAGALPFDDALQAVSARGRGMTNVAVEDNGRMAAVFAPLEEIERILKTLDGYVVIANINSEHQAVIGGASKAVGQAIQVFAKAGFEVSALPVSHAFHTSIVAPASEPLRQILKRLRLSPPRMPIVANVDGEFYPMGPDVVPKMVDILARQVASPVQFVKGLRTLYASGARVFVEVGPKKALQGFAEDVLGRHGDVLSLFTNHPKFGDIPSFNQALCGLYAAGLGAGEPVHEIEVNTMKGKSATPFLPTSETIPVQPVNAGAPMRPAAPLGSDHYLELGRYFADVLEHGWQIHHREIVPSTEPVVITGASLGLPGTERVFDDDNIARMLRGDQFIDVVPTKLRRAMLEKHITRLVKSDNGGPTFETINNIADVIKLAGQGSDLDLEKEFGVSADRVAALDRVTQLAIAAGIDALRDAGIPLVMRYKTTSKGTQLPERWGLPDELRDETSVIFASAFPGYDSFAEIMSRYYADHARHEQVAMLENLRMRVTGANGHSLLGQEIDRRIEELRTAIEKEPFVFDRRFLFRVLSMGHSQFAEYIGARGPNTQINSACASTTQGVSLAQDWIRAGRCRRAIVISADDITSNNMMEWFGAGFLASGAAATDDVLEEAALPFDRRRHGLIVGMGAAALVVESADAARERGIQPICEVLSAVTANSAFHGTRLDVDHIGQIMENLVLQAESHAGIRRDEIAPKTVFVSHETYTPARGGSASAEIYALRRVFGSAADQIVIANTKGFTGHAMGAGIEDVVAVKALETGCVPPVPNFKEVDPELGTLNLSKGGSYPVEYALRLGAGFGSQISMTLLRWVTTKDGARRSPNACGYAYRIADPEVWNAWLSRIACRPSAHLEVVRHTLRVQDQGAPALRVAETHDLRSVPAPAPLPQTVPVVSPPTSKPPITASSPSVNNNAPEREVGLATPPVTIPGDAVKERVLALVAEKTGYPVDMLDLDLDLEADLGVDTVKQAEVFATIREAYNIQRDDQVKLRDFPTLAHVIGFVHQRRPDLVIAAPGQAAASVQATAVPEVEVKISTAAPGTGTAEPIAIREVAAVKDRILALVVEKTGYPQDMLDLDLDLEADLGVDTVKQAEMFAAIREIYNIPRDENRKLRDYPTLAHVIQFVYSQRPDLTDADKPAAVKEPLANTDTKSTDPVTVELATPAVISTDDAIKNKILDIVAEKTGYPKDMLDLDLDLEADLGVDTVKQAEMFAAVRAAYNIPRDENLKLRDFPTLAHVIKFAHDRQPGTAKNIVPIVSSGEVAQVLGKSATTSPSASPANEPQLSRPAPANFEAANRIPRRVPVPVLRPPLSICKPTSVTLGPDSRVVLMPDKAGVAAALVHQLESKGVTVLRLDNNSEASALEKRLKDWLAGGPVHGVYWLPAVDCEEPISGMDLATWHESLRIRVKALHLTMRTLYQQIAAPGTFLVSGTRLGGHHGYDPFGASAPLGGAVAGFTKTYKRERIDALVKVVDFEAGRSASEVADILIKETLHDPGAVEIGYKHGLRWTVALEEQPAIDGRPGLQLKKDTIFVITGAAGSIVSAITADLAAASSGIFYLLDLAAKPDAANPDLKRFVNDKDGLKRDLFAQIQARGERATPALVEKELAALERAHAAQCAIDAVQAAGGTAHYFSVNLTDADAVAKVIAQVRRESGRIDVLLHAAGMERSHLLSDKEPHEFDLIFDVKADGWFNILHAIADMPLTATVVFSSIAARFGNAGQTDYSSANDLLCKITSSFRTMRPGTRGIAIDWTAWGGMGMATRGSIPKMMELAGIDMLPPEAGIPLIRRELTAGGTGGEIVVGQRLGILMNEWDATGGVGTLPSSPDLQGSPSGPMIGTLAGVGIHDGLTIETELDPTVQPFLHDHQIEGTPVLPGVMGVEAFAEAAVCMLPGWRIAVIENVDFLAPFKFYRNEPRTLRIQTRISPHHAGMIAHCELIGRRLLANQAEPTVTKHFTASVRLTKEPWAAPRGAKLISPHGSVIEATNIYRVYFHGPAYQVLERAWWDGIRMVGLLSRQLPENHQPSSRPTIIGPRLIELCFQTAGLWEMATQGRMGLPLHIDQVRVWPYPDSLPDQMFAVVTPIPEDGFDAYVVDSAGKRYAEITGYRTVAVPKAIDADSLNALQSLISLATVAA
jgi:acyl transferase domain-containing protein/NAD(P)-dependent dehydrogenase (short-subunit alcohol dehydrogenase family)/acyl carrier protein